MSHGDAFRPHPILASFQRQANGLTYFDSFTGGGAAPVLLVHGNGDEADTWRHVFRPLAAHYRVLAVDLPGFGRSDASADGSLSSLVSALDDFLDAVRLDKLHLVGSSLGAVVCAKLTAKRPPRARSLTLVGGASPALGGVQANPGLKSLLDPGSGEAFYTALRTAGEEAAFETLRPYYAHLDNLPQEDKDFLRARVWARVWSDSQRTAFFAALRSLFAPAAPLQISPEIPVQLIWGELDAIMPRQSAHAVLHQLPQARLDLVRGSGHLPQQEQPEGLLRILESFLSRL